MLKYLLALITAFYSTVSFAKNTTYQGQIEVIFSPQFSLFSQQIRGTVFLDENLNSKLDDNENGIPNVVVSNGIDTVLTDVNGAYILPAYEDMNLFISKPSNYAVPLNKQLVPQFSYVHKKYGSPNLKYGGLPAKESFPSTVNFPLIEDVTGDTFECLVFGDVQTYTNQELSYARDTMGKMLGNRDNSDTECLIFEGDLVGDDLSLFPRLKEVISIGNVPQYFVGGNHDLDLDALVDEDSFDTFRREWGPEYYSFNIGKVHFVVLDNIRYPCNGIDKHKACQQNEENEYNGVITQKQLSWLKKDLSYIPKDRLIVLNAHIPFVSFSKATNARSQTDNLAELYKIIGDRPALGLTGHTHTIEQILPGEHFDGWQKRTKTGPAPFHQIVTGAVSGSWWAGDFGNDGIPHATQALGGPRGYFVISFNGADYQDTFHAFDHSEEKQMHLSINTPRYRTWAEKIFAYAKTKRYSSSKLPPVTVNDLGDVNMITTSDLNEGSWIVTNVWNGSKASTVSVLIDDTIEIEATRTQKGEGEAVLEGVEFSDPYAIFKQATNGRTAFRSTEGKKETEGYTSWRGIKWRGAATSFPEWMLANRSNHIWRADLPKNLSLGLHKLEVTTTDRYGRKFSDTKVFEVVEQLPELNWNP